MTTPGESGNNPVMLTRAIRSLAALAAIASLGVMLLVWAMASAVKRLRG